MLNPFNHFDGGKCGVRCRFLERIKNGIDLDKVSDEDFGLESGTVKRIIDGDILAITERVVEAFCCPCDYTIDEGFGEFVGLTPELLDQWENEAKEDQFVIVGGGTWPKESMIKMFILTRAMSEL